MPTTPPFAAVLLLAAGRSQRMRPGLPEGLGSKAFLTVGGRSALARCLSTFSSAPCVGEIVVVSRPEDDERIARLARDFGREVTRVAGGRERTDSVRSGFGALRGKDAVVLVHDVARPLVRVDRIERVAAEARQHGAALLAVRVTDTIKRSKDGDSAHQTLDRTDLWAARTPQAFLRERLGEALERAAEEEFRPTDDAALHERYFGPVRLVEDDAANMKLTTPADLARAEAWIATRAEEIL